MWDGETLIHSIDYKTSHASWRACGVWDVGGVASATCQQGGPGACCLLVPKCAGRVTAGSDHFPTDIAGCLGSVCFCCMSRRSTFSSVAAAAPTPLLSPLPEIAVDTDFYCQS